jgi:hypothetical protein
MTMTDTTMQFLADAIITARDFCGDEREALFDAAHDLNIKLTAKGVQAAFALANEQYAEYQRLAGVTTPISQGERIHLYNTINSGNG